MDYLYLEYLEELLTYFKRNESGRLCVEVADDDRLKSVLTPVSDSLADALDTILDGIDYDL